MRQQTGYFVAKGSDGQTHTVHVWVDVPDADPHRKEAGATALCTTDGYPVRRISQGRYQLVRSGADLTSDDPNAP
jgi:hypothetical protein